MLRAGKSNLHQVNLTPTSVTPIPPVEGTHMPLHCLMHPCWLFTFTNRKTNNGAQLLSRHISKEAAILIWFWWCHVITITNVPACTITEKKVLQILILKERRLTKIIRNDNVKCCPLYLDSSLTFIRAINNFSTDYFISLPYSFRYLIWVSISCYEADELL